MKVLSIDVGIKNLAFCLFNERKVEKWDVINLSETENKIIHVCSSLIESKKKKNEERKVCGKSAFYQKGATPGEPLANCFCKVHAKQQKELIICPPALKPSALKKAKLDQLRTLASELKVVLPESSKKETLLALLNDFRDKNCLQEIKKEKDVNCSKIDLVTVGKAIKVKFNNVFSAEEKVDCVLIENQIGPMAIRMKAIQGMLAQYFIMRETCEKIEFVNAGNKLKHFDKDSQETYKDRKQLGIVKCVEELNKDIDNAKLVSFLETHKKKDDLADCFLQGVWYLEK